MLDNSLFICIHIFLFMYNMNLRSQSFSFVHFAPPPLPQLAIINILLLCQCLSIHVCVRMLLIRCSMLSLIPFLSKFRSLIKHPYKIEWRVSEFVRAVVSYVRAVVITINGHLLYHENRFFSFCITYTSNG